MSLNDVLTGYDVDLDDIKISFIIGSLKFLNWPPEKRSKVIAAAEKEYELSDDKHDREALEMLKELHEYANKREAKLGGGVGQRGGTIIAVSK